METNEMTQNKYNATLAKYNTKLNDNDVAAQVSAIIDSKVAENNTLDVKKFLFLHTKETHIN